MTPRSKIGSHAAQRHDALPHHGATRRKRCGVSVRIFRSWCTSPVGSGHSAAPAPAAGVRSPTRRETPPRPACRACPSRRAWPPGAAPRTRRCLRIDQFLSWALSALLHAPTPAAGLVYASGRMFVAAIVQDSQVARQAKEETKFLEAQVRGGEAASPSLVYVASIRRSSTSRAVAWMRCPKETSACGKTAPPSAPATGRTGSASRATPVVRARFASSVRPSLCSSFACRRHSSALSPAKFRKFKPRGQAPLEPPGSKDVRIQGVSVRATRKPTK